VIERRLYLSVDCYSGMIYSASGIPRSMVMFAVARMLGWMSRWTEMMADPDNRLERPRQIYSGPM